MAPPMIHFFLSFSRTAADSPFGQRLTESGVQSRIIAGEVRHRFRHRLWMVFVGRPQTALFAVKAAFRSLVAERPPPRVVVVWTHIEALVVGALRWLCGRRQTKIVLVGFILTARSGWLHNLLRRIYFRTVFSVVDLAIVHSSVEAARYAVQFSGCKARFAFIPWGSHIDASASAPTDGSTAADVLCAGRSGRDYPTLYRALAGTRRQVRIVCDLAEALNGCEPAANMQVLNNVYGNAYLQHLQQARCVAIPLAAGDISAGQMVLLQAMELGKPIVMTRTATTVDYVTDGHDALLVDPGQPDALRGAVERLLGEPALADTLGRNARATFNRRFTIPAFVDSLVKEIQVLDAAAGAAPLAGDPTAKVR